ncbi:MAG: hypothetical protein J6A99_02665 [Clostridia bacterium]|nr:hypothetical protein [Clostridia bacterium]
MRVLEGVHCQIERVDDGHEGVRREWCGHYDLTTKRCKIFGESCKTDSPCGKYWPFKKPKEEIQEIKDEVRPFGGIREINIADIRVVGKHSKLTNEDKKGILKYYEEHQEFYHPISVECDNDKYVLKEFYKIYQTAKEIGLSTIKCKMYPGVPYSEIKKYRVIGKKIQHVTHGCGRVVDIVKNNRNGIEVEFDNGKRMKIDVVTCIKDKLLINKQKANKKIVK